MEARLAVTRFLIVAPEYPPETIGGGGVVFAELARRYMAKGDVLIITGQWRSPQRGPRLEILAPRGVLVRVPLIRNPLDLPALRTTLPPNRSGRALLRTLINAWRPSVAHLHGYGYLVVDWAARLLWEARIPYVFTSHGLPVSPKEGRLSMVKVIAYRGYQVAFADKTARGAAVVTAVSHSAMPSCVDGMVVPNGVAPLPSVGYLERCEYKLSGWRVAACGRIAHSKGFDVLLQALGRLAEPSIECVIIGANGGDLAHLTRLARTLAPNITVRFAGPTDRRGIATVMAWADIVVMPSRVEPFGLVAFEGLAAGKRVVASRTGGLGEWLGDPALPVVLVEPADDGALAEGIVTAMQRGAPSERESQAVRTLLDSLDWDVVARQYLDLLQNLEHHDESRRCGENQSEW